MSSQLRGENSAQSRHVQPGPKKPSEHVEGPSHRAELRARRGGHRDQQAGHRQ